MGAPADLIAYLMQRSARRTVDYGAPLYFSGMDLPPPASIQVPTRHGPVRCDVYHPRDTSVSPPVYIQFHGGAFIMRHPKRDDFLARFIAAECDAVVITGEYDSLRAEGDAYARRLSEAGVEVVHRVVVPRTDHYFLDGDRSRSRNLLDLIALTLNGKLTVPA